MRYAKTESTYILGAFDSGDTVSIYIYRLSDITPIIEGEPCTEIGNTGIFKYEFSQEISQKEEYLWIMTNGSYTRSGKIVLGGYIDYIDEYISSRASEETLQEVKSKTDKMKFNPDNDIIATLDDEKVNLTDELHNAILLLKKINTGRWKIDNNKLTMYDSDGVTPIIVFDLYDKEGNPTEVNVFERVPE